MAIVIGVLGVILGGIQCIFFPEKEHKDQEIVTFTRFPEDIHQFAHPQELGGEQKAAEEWAAFHYGDVFTRASQPYAMKIHWRLGRIWEGQGFLAFAPYPQNGVNVEYRLRRKGEKWTWETQHNSRLTVPPGTSIHWSTQPTTGKKEDVIDIWGELKKITSDDEDGRKRVVFWIEDVQAPNVR
jgi:hypothetical protein